MLEKLPRALGAALSGLKAGIDKTAYHAAFGDVPETLSLTSTAFAEGAQMPARVTEDGARVSPPLAWSGLPPGTARIVVLVEDSDSPTPDPLVHLIAWDLARDLGGLREGDLPGPAGLGAKPDLVRTLGKNSLLKVAWLPPDPPTGHGPHAYLFQAYALDRPLELGDAPGRGAVIEAMRGRVLARGSLTGIYLRP